MLVLSEIPLLRLYGYDNLFLKALALHPIQSLIGLLRLSLIADSP